VVIHFIRAKRRRRPTQPQVVPDPRLRYGQVVKQDKGRRLVSVTRRVIFGVAELIPLTRISTSLLEQLNGTIRQHVPSLHRKTRSTARVPRSARYARATLQELLQPLPAARHIERTDACASGWFD
jgi:hypothetical protein